MNISSFMGKVFISVERQETDTFGDLLIFTETNGSRYGMLHQQDCCEDVHINDICGDLQDLTNSPILYATEERSDKISSECNESSTWTFYKIDTLKGGITIRWIGTSNGYYTEEADIYPLNKDS